MHSSSFVSVSSHIYCTQEGSFPMHTFFRKATFLHMLQIILLMSSFHFRPVYYSKDNETHSSVPRTLGKLKLRGVLSPETIAKSLHQNFQNLLILTIFLGSKWSDSVDWQSFTVCPKWSIIGHMAHWECPEIDCLIWFLYRSQVNFWQLLLCLWALS